MSHIYEDVYSLEVAGIVLRERMLGENGHIAKKIDHLFVFNIVM